MIISSVSILSGASSSKEIDVTPNQLAIWSIGGMLIQNAMPNISAEDRDFIKGIFWDECGLNDVADVYSDEFPEPPKEIILDLQDMFAAIPNGLF